MLAFKNDVSHWKQKNEMVGVSLRSVSPPVLSSQVKVSMRIYVDRAQRFHSNDCTPLSDRQQRADELHDVRSFDTRRRLTLIIPTQFVHFWNGRTGRGLEGSCRMIA